MSAKLMGLLAAMASISGGGLLPEIKGSVEKTPDPERQAKAQAKRERKNAHRRKCTNGDRNEYIDY